MSLNTASLLCIPSASNFLLDLGIGKPSACFYAFLMMHSIFSFSAALNFRYEVIYTMQLMTKACMSGTKLCSCIP